jgi:hypothetical protein
MSHSAITIPSTHTFSRLVALYFHLNDQDVPATKQDPGAKQALLCGGRGEAPWKFTYYLGDQASRTVDDTLGMSLRLRAATMQRQEAERSGEHDTQKLACWEAAASYLGCTDFDLCSSIRHMMHGCAVAAPARERAGSS